MGESTEPVVSQPRSSNHLKTYEGLSTAIDAAPQPNLSASDQLVERLMARSLVHEQSTPEHRPLGEKLGFYARAAEGGKRVYSPKPFEASVKRVREKVQSGAAVWRQQDGSSHRSDEAVRELDKLLHRLDVLRRNKDVRSPTVDAFAQFIDGSVPDREGFAYGVYAVDHKDYGSVGEDPIKDAAFVQRKAERSEKLAQMKASGRYQVLDEGDWCYFNHSPESAMTATDRIYISAETLGDSAALIEHWTSALDQAGIGTELMFKVTRHPTRLDTIVAYPGPNIDPDKLRLALVIFHSNCPQELLDEEGIETGHQIARGISTGPEYSKLSSISRVVSGEKTSFGGVVTELLELAMKLSYKYMEQAHVLSGQTAESFKPTLRQLLVETKRCFRELLICDGINPDTMIPFARGGKIPDWAAPIEQATQAA